MFRRIVFSAVLAGLIAGMVLSILQHYQVVPIILAAETYESAAPSINSPDHSHNDDQASHPHAHAPWAPQDGIERVFFTVLANVATAIGFALILGAIFTLRKQANAGHGLLWGGAGFLVFFALPALGLPPEIPGAFGAGLDQRQIWWLLTVICSAAGLALLFLHQTWGWKIAGLILLSAPHMMGAPQPETHGGSAPQELADAFIIASIIVNAIFWLLLGALSGFFFNRIAQAQ